MWSARASPSGSKGAGLGGELKYGDKPPFRVVGLFTAGGSAAESEVWVDLSDLEQRLNRSGYVSSTQLRADLGGRPRTHQEDDPDDNAQFKLAAMREADYYAEQAQQAGILFKVAGTMIAVALTVGRDVRRGEHHVRGREVADPRDRDPPGGSASPGSTSSRRSLGGVGASPVSSGGQLGMLATLP